MEISNFKMAVTPEQSRTVQEFLFKNGYDWAYGNHACANINKKILCFDGTIMMWANSFGEIYGDYEELTFKQFKEKYMKKTLNTQVGGNHYQDFPIQPIEFIMKNSLSFPVGNIIKYVCRFDKKNGLEDLNKAKHYLEILIESYDIKE